MSILKKISLIVMGVFYLLSGINHFISPENYLAIIPPYLPLHTMINYAAGIAEICGAVLLFIPATRSFAAWGIICMLIAFMPAHIYMVQQAPMLMGTATITPLIAWLRIPIQALLIWWAYSFTAKKK